MKFHLNTRSISSSLLVLVALAGLQACGGGGGDAPAPASDTTPPVISLLGTTPLNVEAGVTFTDPGATVTDNVDTGLTATVTGTVDTTIAGSYTLTYNASDAAGNAATPVTRTVNVLPDTIPPVISLLGTTPLNLEAGIAFTDPGATVTDNVDTGLTATVTGAVNTTIAGSYTLTYNASDAAGNAAAPVTRTVNVLPDTIPPVISLIGTTPLNVEAGAVFTDPGATVTDNVDTGLTATVTGTVDTSIFGASYTLTYNASDAAGNAATPVTRTVNVQSAPVPTLSFGLKQLNFSWPAITGVDHYKISVNPDGASGFTTVAGADAITATSHSVEIPVHLTDWFTAQYLVEACNVDESVCVGSTNQTLTPANSVAAIGYFKASNAEEADFFGDSVSVSADGYTMAVGAYWEDSASTGVNSTPDEAAGDSGAVYVFSRTATTAWSQQAYIKASNTQANDYFSRSISISADGNTLAVGAYQEGSSTTGINSTPDEGALKSGAVYVFSRTGTTWSQQAYIKASNTQASDYFGYSVSISGDGNTLAVGAYWEDSATTGVNSTPVEGATNSGAVYVFSRTDTTWSEQAYLKASNTQMYDLFGHSVSVSADGNTLAVGAYGEDSGTTGVNGTPDEFASTSGAVYVFSRTGTTWSEQAYIKASNTEESDRFGYSVSISGDGNTLAVGAYYEDSATTGVNSTPDELATDSGAVYVFSRTDTTWSEQAYLKASNTQASDWFGYSISINADGNTLAVGAYFEDSGTTGVSSTPDEAASASGAVYVFSRASTTWSEKSYLKSLNTQAFDYFGYSVSISGDGNTLAVGAYGEDSATTGVNSTPAEGALSSGAVYMY